MCSPLKIMDEIARDGDNLAGCAIWNPELVAKPRTALERQQADIDSAESRLERQAEKLEHWYEAYEEASWELAQSKALVQQALAFFKAPEDGDLMEEIEHQRHAHLEALSISGEQLAQKDARIARLESSLSEMVEAWDARHECDPFSQVDLPQREHAQAILNEPPAQSAAALKAEALREFGRHLQNCHKNEQANGYLESAEGTRSAADEAFYEADRIEREAKGVE